MRRSSRSHVPTARAQQYNELVQRRVRDFPRKLDEIKVKWELDGKIIWWPATVLSVTATPQDSCEGELLYHSYEHYAKEHASVVFISKLSNDRSTSLSTVQHLGSSNTPSGSSTEASWVYASDKIPDDSSNVEHSPPTISAPARSTHNNNTARLKRSSAHAASPFRSARKSSPAQRLAKTRRCLSLSSSSGLSCDSREFRPTKPVSASRTPSAHPSTDTLPVTAGVSKRQQDPATSRSGSVPLPTTSKPGQIIVPPGSESNNADNDVLTDSRDATSLATNFQHLQSQLQILHDRMGWLSSQQQRPTSEYTMSASTQGILMSLKWSLLKKLEKPLKPIRCQQLAEIGVSSDTISVRVNCPAETFRDITAHLVHKFGLDNPQRHSSTPVRNKVAFWPSYNTILDGSTSANKYITVFNTLSELTDLIGIRNEEDYEFMLTKELISDNKTFLRVIGSMAVINSANAPLNRQATGAHRTSSLQSTTVHSASPPILRLHIGSITHEQVDDVNNDENNMTDTAIKIGSSSSSAAEVRHSARTDNIINTVVFEQVCRHFDTDLGGFRSAWNSRPTSTVFSFPTHRLDTDKLSSPMFSLTWTRNQQPSKSKWSTDVQITGSHIPGQLLLSIPCIFTSSSYNVKHISRLLDVHIELFIEQRQQLRKM